MRVQTALLLTAVLSPLLLLVPAAASPLNGGGTCYVTAAPPSLTTKNHYCLTVQTMEGCYSASPTCQTVYVQLERTYTNPVLADGTVDAQDGFRVLPQIWIESNHWRGLQETICACGGGPLPPDTKVLIL